MCKKITDNLFGLLAGASFLRFAVFTPHSDMGIILSFLSFLFFTGLFLWKTGIYKDIIELLDNSDEDIDKND